MFHVIIRILAKCESVGIKFGPVTRGGADTVTTGALFEEAEGSSACQRRAKLLGWANKHKYRDDEHADLCY
jgi:hypothetical protein